MFISNQVQKRKSGRRLYHCEECDYVSNYQSNFKDHMGKHSNELQSCELCSFQTKSLKNLSRHKLQHQNKRYKCSQCSYESIYSYSIKKHMEWHAGKKQKCPLCDYKSYCKSNLTKHLMRHSLKPVKDSKPSNQIRNNTIRTSKQTVHKLIHNPLECNEVKLAECNEDKPINTGDGSCIDDFQSNEDEEVAAQSSKMSSNMLATEVNYDHCTVVIAKDVKVNGNGNSSSIQEEQVNVFAEDDEPQISIIHILDETGIGFCENNTITSTISADIVKGNTSVSYVQTHEKTCVSLENCLENTNLLPLPDTNREIQVQPQNNLCEVYENGVSECCGAVLHCSDSYADNMYISGEHCRSDKESEHYSTIVVSENFDSNQMQCHCEQCSVVSNNFLADTFIDVHGNVINNEKRTNEDNAVIECPDNDENCLQNNAEINCKNIHCHNTLPLNIQRYTKDESFTSCSSPVVFGGSRAYAETTQSNLCVTQDPFDLRFRMSASEETLEEQPTEAFTPPVLQECEEFYPNIQIPLVNNSTCNDFINDEYQEVNCQQWSNDKNGNGSNVMNKTNENNTNHEQQSKKNNKEKNLFSCDLCSFQTDKKSSLRSHKKNHMPEKPFICSECSFKSKYKCSLQLHIKTKHSNQSNSSSWNVTILKCSVCNFTTRHESSLRRHTKRHLNKSKVESKEAARRKCVYCSETFSDKLSLFHHSISHRDEKKYSCNLCSYKTDLKDSLKLHILRHIKRDDPNNAPQNHYLIDMDTLTKFTNFKPRKTLERYKCQHCTYECTGRTQLNLHRRSKHSEIYFIKCSVCEFTCNTRKVLHEHYSVHPTELPFSCSTCTFRAKTAALIERHERTHKKSSIFSCTKCSFTAVYKRTIVLHIRKHRDANFVSVSAEDEDASEPDEILLEASTCKT